MNQRAVMAGITLVAALMSVGCASGPSPAEQKRIGASAIQMCQAHGGKWSPAEETCEMSATEARQAKRHARDICAYQGGTYLPGGTCILPGT